MEKEDTPDSCCCRYSLSCRCAVISDRRGEQLPDVPFRILAACAKDEYRKPMLGMWNELERIFKEHDVEIGRFKARSKIRESMLHLSQTRGVLFLSEMLLVVRTTSHRLTGSGPLTLGYLFTHRRCFKFSIRRSHLYPYIYRSISLTSRLPHTSYLDFTYQVYLQVGCPALTLFTCLTHLIVEPITPSNVAILPDSSEQELVIFTGYPCLGKSSFYHKHFSPADYTHINQDTLSSRQKCVKATEEALKAGKSVVVGMYSLSLCHTLCG